MKTICTLRNMIRRNVELNADKIALIEGDRRYTFAQLARRTDGLGNALLKLGLDKGDRVAILGPNSIENAEAYFDDAVYGHGVLTAFFEPITGSRPELLFSALRRGIHPTLQYLNKFVIQAGPG